MYLVLPPLGTAEECSLCYSAFHGVVTLFNEDGHIRRVSISLSIVQVCSLGLRAVFVMWASFLGRWNGRPHIACAVGIFVRFKQSVMIILQNPKSKIRKHVSKVTNSNKLRRNLGESIGLNFLVTYCRMIEVSIRDLLV